LGFGGVPVNQLTKQMLEIFGKVTLLGTSQHINDPWRFQTNNLTLILVPSSPRARNRALTLFSSEIKHLLLEIRLSKPDLVHAHWTYEFARAALNSKTPTLVTVHDDPVQIFRQMPDAYRFIRMVMAIRNRIKMSHVNFVSPYLLHQWKKNLIWKNKKDSQVITNLSPFDLIEFSQRQESENPYVISVGDSSPRKNIRNLIKAWAEVEVQDSELMLFLLGNGLDDKSELARYAESLHTRNIVFLGFKNRDDTEKLIEGAMMMVHPSFEESQGLVLTEALSKGCPVIAGKNSGAVGWTLGDSGILVNVRESGEISSAILSLRESPSLRETIARKGLAHFREEFDTTAIVSKYLNAYDQVLKSN